MKVYQNILRDINFIVLKNESESLLKIFKQKIAPKRCHFWFIQLRFLWDMTRFPSKQFQFWKSDIKAAL